MKPIPKKLLIHNATAVKKTPSDMWGKSNDAARTELSRVRIEPSSSLVISKDNQQIQLNAVLFFDCVNSKPTGFNFAGAEKIEVDKVQYNIVSVKQYFDERKLHHLEVGLCL